MNKLNVKANATYTEIKKTGKDPLEWELNRGPEYWEYRRKWVELPKNKISPTPNRPSESGIRSSRTIDSPNSSTDSSSTHQGDVACNQMALAAVVKLMEVR